MPPAAFASYKRASDLFFAYFQPFFALKISARHVSKRRWGGEKSENKDIKKK
jgi:hypothetical protein